MSSISSHKHSLDRLLVGLVFTASAGCAGNIDQLRHGRAAGEWQVRLPESRSTVGELAMGRGGSSEAAKSWFDETSDVSFESQPPVADAGKRKPRATRLRKTATPAPQHAEPGAPALQPAELPKRSAPQSLAPVEYAMADTSAHARYAERESSSQQQQQFKGGNLIIIGVSSLVVILLVVLLILLLL